MPVSIALLNHVYAGHASIDPLVLARQVFTAQLLPLWLGMLIRSAVPALAERHEPALSQVAAAMLIVLAALAIVDIAKVVVGAGPRILTESATCSAGPSPRRGRRSRSRARRAIRGWRSSSRRSTARRRRSPRRSSPTCWCRRRR
jgi:hypothetical protein